MEWRFHKSHNQCITEKVNDTENHAQQPFLADQLSFADATSSYIYPPDFIPACRTKNSSKRPKDPKNPIKSKQKFNAEMFMKHNKVYKARPPESNKDPIIEKISNNMVHNSSTKSYAQSPCKKKKSISKRQSVDFVYDVKCRTQLRQAMDLDRLQTLKAAITRENELRKAGRWLPSCKPSKEKRNAVQPNEVHNNRNNEQTPKPVEAGPRIKVALIGSPRYCKIGHDKTTNIDLVHKEGSCQSTSGKTSIAPNIHEWRPQSAPFFVCKKTSK